MHKYLRTPSVIIVVFTHMQQTHSTMFHMQFTQVCDYIFGKFGLVYSILIIFFVF